MSVMKTLIKTSLLLILVAFLTSFLPAGLARAQGTTVEVNNGNPIILNAGQTLAGSPNGGIPVTVRNLPNPGARNGLAAFTFRFTWDPAVVRMDSAKASTSSADWSGMFPGNIDNQNGVLTSAGFTTTYSTSDIILLYFGVTAVGKPGTSTSISVAVVSLGMSNGTADDIIYVSASPVSAPVKISSTPISTSTAPKLVSITVTSNPSISVGSTRQLAAIGSYDDTGVADITSQVAWTSSNEAAATVQTIGTAKPGLAAGLAAGTTTIKATLGTVSATTQLTVTRPEEKAVTPPAPPAQPPGTPPQTGTPAKPPATNPPAATQTQPPAGAPTTAPGAPQSPPEPSGTAGTINWWLIGGLAAGLIVLGVGGYFLLRKRA